MRFRKLLLLALALAIFSFAACSKKDEGTSKTTDPDSGSPADSRTTTSKDDIHPADLVLTISGETTLEMMKVPGGMFRMGDQTGNGDDDELPVFEQRIDTFLMGKTEITKQQWASVMSDNPASVAGNNFPVTNITWEDAMEFVKRLNVLTGYTFRLPTESEWEYAARSVETGSGEQEAWASENSSGTAHTVGMLKPNAYGLHDLFGNVSEWCYDRYGYYPKTHWMGPLEGNFRILRGGSYLSRKPALRPANRNAASPTVKGPAIGLRIVLSADEVNKQSRKGRAVKEDVSCGDIFVNGEPYEFVQVGKGVFDVKKPPYSEIRGSGSEDAEPQLLKIELSTYCIGKFKVTQSMWESVMGENPSTEKGPDLPVEGINYPMAVEFMDRINYLTDRTVRLPTEAEWEYACRNSGKEESDPDPGKLDRSATHQGNSSQEAKIVGTGEPNGLNIYNMTGDVNEWCSNFWTYASRIPYDYYQRTYPDQDVISNPKGPTGGQSRIYKGGNLRSQITRIKNQSIREHQCSNRGSADPGNGQGIGLRLVAVP